MPTKERWIELSRSQWWHLISHRKRGEICVVRTQRKAIQLVKDDAHLAKAKLAQRSFRASKQSCCLTVGWCPGCRSDLPHERRIHPLLVAQARAVLTRTPTTKNNILHQTREACRLEHRGSLGQARRGGVGPTGTPQAAQWLTPWALDYNFSLGPKGV